MGIMIVNEFEIRSYGWQELAVLYGPDLMPESAGKRLSKWVGADPVLETELQGYGWRKGKKTLTPRQVKTIVQFLGEPSKVFYNHRNNLAMLYKCASPVQRSEIGRAHV